MDPEPKAPVTWGGPPGRLRPLKSQWQVVLVTGSPATSSHSSYVPALASREAVIEQATDTFHAVLEPGLRRRRKAEPAISPAKPSMPEGSGTALTAELPST
jgi:hypothetical protein